MKVRECRRHLHQQPADVGRIENARRLHQHRRTSIVHIDWMRHLHARSRRNRRDYREDQDQPQEDEDRVGQRIARPLDPSKDALRARLVGGGFGHAISPVPVHTQQVRRRTSMGVARNRGYGRPGSAPCVAAAAKTRGERLQTANASSNSGRKFSRLTRAGGLMRAPP
jgi:hypothetical protein